MKWKGELYALPYDFSNIGIYYNKKMFDDAKVAYPTNDDWKWDELLQTGLEVRQEGREPDQDLGLDMYLWNWVFHGVMFGWGGKVWSDDFKTSLVNSKENLDCFKWFIAARKQGLYPEAGAMPQGVNPFGGSWCRWPPGLMGHRPAARCDRGQVRLRCASPCPNRPPARRASTQRAARGASPRTARPSKRPGPSTSS